MNTTDFAAERRSGAAHDQTRRSDAAPLERDRLGRFFPALVALSFLSAAVEAISGLVLHEAALTTAGASTCLFGIGLLVAGQRIRAGDAVGARVAVAICITVVGAIGAFLIPGVVDAFALLPIVSVVLVLPHLPRGRLVAVVAAAVASTIGIFVLDQMPHALPAVTGITAIVFDGGMLVGVAILVLLGLADFAMDARDSIRDLRESTNRQLQVTAERLAFVAALRMLHAQANPEATAAAIATALSDLPLVDIAAVFEPTDDGLRVLAAVGHEVHPIHVDDHLLAQRANYLLERSVHGPWAELWADRSGPTFEDERLAQLGLQGQAFAPILACDEVVGLICIATKDRDQAMHLVADLPSVSEAAAVAGAILAPALLARRDLRKASVRIADTIASGGFHPVFQPVIDLETGQTVGYEALTRFAAGDAPDQMFADAAKAGLGAELETATLAAAVRDASLLPPGAWLSLNVSPSLLAECSMIEALLAHRTRPIVLEITEHDIIDDYAPLHAAMGRLGPDVRLAVDDAGAGVANFGHLVELRPDIVKIDAGLVHGVNADVSRQAVIVGLVHFAAMAGSLVLAEGVETEAEHETVKRLGVTLGQGHYFARPARVDQWASTIASRGAAVTPTNVIPIRRRVTAG